MSRDALSRGHPLGSWRVATVGLASSGAVGLGLELTQANPFVGLHTGIAVGVFFVLFFFVWSPLLAQGELRSLRSLPFEFDVEAYLGLLARTHSRAHVIVKLSFVTPPSQAEQESISEPTRH